MARQQRSGGLGSEKSHSCAAGGLRLRLAKVLEGAVSTPTRDRFHRTYFLYRSLPPLVSRAKSAAAMGHSGGKASIHLCCKLYKATLLMSSCLWA